MSKFSRILAVTPVLGVLLFLALHQASVPVLGATISSAYSVAVAWDPNPVSDEVTGYRVLYGTVSRNYTNSIVVGNMTTNSVSGLTAGTTYFFAVTAYNANGLESDFSDEISYVPGLPRVWTRVTPIGQTVLKVSGLIDHTYDIEATEDFTAWIVIGTVTLGANGAMEFTDSAAASYPKRFYRSRLTP